MTGGEQKPKQCSVHPGDNESYFITIAEPPNLIEKNDNDNKLRNIQ